MRNTTLRRKALGLLVVLFVAQMTAASGALAAASGTTAFQVEQRLAALRFDVGPVDGVVDAQSSSAILAFQKVYGLDRTGTPTDPVAAQILAAPGLPPPQVPGGGPNRVVVDLTRQVLFLYEGNSLFAVLPVSTGAAATPTPTGSFRFLRYDPGWHTSRLGSLYNAVYFYGGFAIHGSLSVPAQPVSHGCIRIPMSAAEWFPGRLTTATAVYVTY